MHTLGMLYCYQEHVVAVGVSSEVSWDDLTASHDTPCLEYCGSLHSQAILVAHTGSPCAVVNWKLAELQSASTLTDAVTALHSTL